MTARAARRIRRVLVALDASPGAVAAAAAAARMAAALEVELEGLFVEDRDLLRLSRSPQARQIGLLTATAERADAGEIERQLRAQAKRARRTLSRLASQAGVTCTFRVTRGSVAREILAAAGSEDLITAGRIGWSHGHRRRLGSTARALIARRRASTLLIDRGAAVAAPLAVLYDGSEAAEEALRLALRLAGRSAGGVVVLATDSDTARQAAARLGEPADPARLDRLDGPLPEALRRQVESRRPGLLVLPVGGPGLRGGELADLLADLRCPVLTVS